MPVPNDPGIGPWPALSYPDFADTHYLLHRGAQMIGKLKLKEPFQPQWSGIALWASARGLTTGAISYAGAAYEVIVDLVSHETLCVTSWGSSARFPLDTMPVAEFLNRLVALLDQVGVDVTINLNPQEVDNPIPFDRDTAPRRYVPILAHQWWRILLSTQRVMRAFKGGFQGKTQPIGLMWGTFDIRDVVYNGKPASPGAGADYIRRNAMNAELIEMGWWAGSVAYPKPAFYSFTYPEPAEIEHATVQPAAAHWDAGMREFILDYDALRGAPNPDRDLLAFFRSTYAAGAKCAAWDAGLMQRGVPR